MNLAVVVFKPDACAVLTSFSADCSLKYFQFAPLSWRCTRHLSTLVGLAQATASVPIWHAPFLRGFQDTRGHIRIRKIRLLAERTRHMSTVDTLAQATVLCPPFCPPFEMVFRPQGDNKGYRGRQETGRFYWRFLFCSGKPEGKDRSGGERSNPLSYAGLNKMACFKEMNQECPPFCPPFLNSFCPLVKYRAACG